MTRAEGDEPPSAFDGAFRDELHRLFAWRRDVRRFRRDPLPHGTLDRLLALASLAPSVGLSEPWRFVLVESAGVRQAVRACFERCNAQALASYEGARAQLYAQLKLAGLDDAPCQFGLFADHGSVQGHMLGRSTMPETLDYSAVLSIGTLWLAARAEGLGLGWVSILDPAEVTAILDVPAPWRFIGYFCLGLPVADSDTPALQDDGWEHRALLSERVVRR